MIAGERCFCRPLFFFAMENKKDNKVEYVYVLTNPAMPEYVKVGRTNNIERRIKDLSKDTSVPLPFECYAYLCISGERGETSSNVEHSLHSILAGQCTKNKEFFKTSPESVVEVFRYSIGINPSMKLVICNQPPQEKTQHSSRTTFAFLNIPVGSELVYKLNPEIKCTVFNSDNKVLYNGSATTLSAIACKLENRSVNGFERFFYPSSDFPNETLWERRKRLEKD